MTRRMLLAVMCAAGAAAPARADRLLSFLPEDQLPKNVKVHPAGTLHAEAVVEITPGATAATKVIEDADPRVPSHLYLLSGKIKYEEVDQPGYVEMWSHFAGGGQFFSRTLDERTGPMMKISGTHNWREVSLPFQSKPGMLPEKLVVNIVLPGKGKVYLTELKLTAWQAAWSGDVWWGDETGMWIGAIGGSTLGLLGAVIGTLCGIGVGRHLVRGLTFAAVAVCSLSLIAGLAALAQSQPYHVYYPLLLLGGIGVVVFGLNLPTIRKRYEAIELRKMAAMDA